MKLKRISFWFVWVGVFVLGTLSSALEIPPSGSIYYQFEQGRDVAEERLQIEAFVTLPKQAGFLANALFIRVNGKTLTAACLLGREPKEAIMDGRTFTYVSTKGGLSIPYTSSVSAFDASPYALSSGESAALYTFDLSGISKTGKNLVEVYNATESRTVTVEFVACNMTKRFICI